MLHFLEANQCGLLFRQDCDRLTDSDGSTCLAPPEKKSKHNNIEYNGLNV